MGWPEMASGNQGKTFWNCSSKSNGGNLVPFDAGRISQCHNRVVGFVWFCSFMFRQKWIEMEESSISSQTKAWSRVLHWFSNAFPTSGSI